MAIDFVVHRGRIIPTLASMQEPIASTRYRQSKERSNMELKTDDRGKRIQIKHIFSFIQIYSCFRLCLFVFKRYFVAGILCSVAQITLNLRNKSHLRIHR